MELILVRHTTPQVAPGICYGQLDCPLTRNGHLEMERTMALVQKDLEENIPIFTSPLKRCAVLAQKMSPNAQIDIRLKEMNFGIWEGKPWADIKDEKYQYWIADFVNRAAPGGESLSDLDQRIQHFFEELQAQNLGKALIVAHSGVIRCFLRMALQFPLSQLYTLPLNYGSVCRMQLSKKSGHLHKITAFNVV